MSQLINFQPENLLEYCLLSNFSFQSYQSFFYHIASYQHFFCRIQLRVTQWMRDRYSRNNPVSTYSNGDRYYGSNVNNRHYFFDFFNERCTATRTSASGGGQNGGGNPGILQVHGNFGTVNLGVGYGSTVTYCRVKLVVQRADAT